MTVGVSHSLAGDVVVVSMDSGARIDLSPDQAEKAAERCERAAAAGVAALLVFEALEGRSFRFAGEAEDYRLFAADLRLNAERGRQLKTAAGAGGGDAA